MRAPARFSRREMLLGRFLRGLAEGVADELHRETVERATERAGQAVTPAPGDQVPPTRTAVAIGPPRPAPTWNPPPVPGRFATPPDLPPPPPIVDRYRRKRHRPPGAVSEPAFLAGCTRGNDCAEACPVDAIEPVPDGPDAGTPHIRAAVRACVSCADTPCISACGPGVLTLARGVTMGTAKIAAAACTAFRGSGCTRCADECPVPGAIAVEHSRPRIVADACTGCGVCHMVCPAPRNAVLLSPGVD